MSYLSSWYPKPATLTDEINQREVIRVCTQGPKELKRHYEPEIEYLANLENAERTRLDKLRVWTNSVFAEAKSMIGDGHLFRGAVQVADWLEQNAKDVAILLRSWGSGANKLVLRDLLQVISARCLYTLFHLGIPVSEFPGEPWHRRDWQHQAGCICPECSPDLHPS